MDFDLSEQQEAARRLARDFCQAEVAPRAPGYDRDEAFPDDLLPALFDVGFLGAAIPEAYGGMGLDYLSYGLVAEELGRVDAAMRSLVSVSMALVGLSVLRWGDDAQRQTWLPRLCSEGLGAFALTEPDAGSDPSSLRTGASRDGDDWILNGNKIFITNGSRGIVSLVFARVGQDDRGETDGITAFLVPQDAPGYVGTPIKHKLGLRAGDTAEVALRDIRVPDANRLGGIGQGMRVALSALDNGRYSLAAGCTGIAQGALDAALAYADTRMQFGRKIAGFQLVQELLADCYVDVEAARALYFRVAWRHERGERHTVESSVAKTFCSEAAVRCADRAVQVHGGYGYVGEYSVERFLRDARVTTLYEGTSQVQRLLLGRHLTGESAFT